MVVRRARNTDRPNLAAPLAKLGAATFTESFGHLYNPEDLQAFIDDAHSEARYQQALDSDNQPIWIAEDKNTLIGYIKLCPADLPCDPPIENAIEISKLYIKIGQQGGGIGGKLVDAALQWSRDQGFSDMVLSVYSENYAGQRFYKRHGFSNIGDYLFAVGQQLDKEFIFHRKL